MADIKLMFPFYLLFFPAIKDTEMPPLQQYNFYLDHYWPLFLTIISNCLHYAPIMQSVMIPRDITVPRKGEFDINNRPL